MNAEISQLVILQELDLEIDQIDKEIKQEQGTLDDRIQKLAEKEELINALTTQISGLEQERRTLEDEIADKMAHVKERQSKMMMVQTGREQTALLKEIEDAKKESKEKEERTIAIMEKTEQLNSQVTEEKNLLKGEKKLITEETEKVRASIEKITKGKKTKISARNKEAAKIKENLIKKYDLLRKRRKGIAVINVENGVCQGCFMSLPPQQFNTLLKGDRMQACPTCQRIIYVKDTASE